MRQIWDEVKRRNAVNKDASRWDEESDRALMKPEEILSVPRFKDFP